MGNIIQIIPADGKQEATWSDCGIKHEEFTSKVIAWGLTDEGEIVPLTLCDNVLSDPRADSNFTGITE